MGPGPQRPKIDPDKIPNPVEVHQADEELYTKQMFQTMCRRFPPLPSTKFVAYDEGEYLLFSL